MSTPILAQKSFFDTLPNRLHVGVAPRRAIMRPGAVSEVILCVGAAAAGAVGCLLLVLGLRL